MKKAFILVLLLCSVHPALACSPGPVYLLFTCEGTGAIGHVPNGTTDVLFSVYNGNITFRMIPGHNSSITEGMQFLSDQCRQNFSAVAPKMENIFREYAAREYRVFRHENTIISPYSPALLKPRYPFYDEKNLLNCRYERVYRLGDFVVNEGGMRDYCDLRGGGDGVCPHAELRHIHFLMFLIKHPGIDTASYLMAYLVVAAMTLWLSIYLGLRKEIILFLKGPSWISFISVGAVSLIVPLFRLWLFPMSYLSTAVLTYLFICTIRYAYVRYGTRTV